MNLDSFWAKSLGCEKEDLKFGKSKMVVRTEETDYNRDRTEKEIDIFEKDGRRIISCSEEVEPRLREKRREIFETDMAVEEFNLTSLKIKELLGPAFLSCTSEKDFNRVKTENCRKLNHEDSSMLQRLKHESDKDEIQNSIDNSQLEDSVIFGKFLENELVAVSSYAVWDNTIGFPDVFVKDEFRGKGYGKEVVSESTNHVLENDLIPVYRTLEKWDSSVGLAKSLGYRKYATTYLLKLGK